MVMVDVLIFGSFFTRSSVETLMALIGFVFMSSVAYNLLFNFISGNYGTKGIITYRLITTLYMFIMPIVYFFPIMQWMSCITIPELKAVQCAVKRCKKCYCSDIFE